LNSFGAIVSGERHAQARVKIGQMHCLKITQYHAGEVATNKLRALTVLGGKSGIAEEFPQSREAFWQADIMCEKG
jgi:hypothetical protein